MIVASTDELRIVVDPDRGAEIRSIYDVNRKIEILFRAPWGARAGIDRPATSQGWVDAWPGGWQMLFPNAGAACLLGGREHGFHGDASVSSWAIVEQQERLVRLEWTDESGLAVTRELTLERGTINARTQIVNRSSVPQPFVLVEHAIFGGPLAEPAAKVILPGGTVVLLGPDGAPGVADTDRPSWPYVESGGTKEEWSRLDGTRRRRLGTILDMPEAWARIDNPRKRVSVTLSWSDLRLPYLRFWVEQGETTESPWNGRVHCVGLEPSTVVGADGLAAALRRRDAIELRPGETWDSWVELEIGAMAARRKAA